MKELILSDITLMGAGYCVIGLERLAPNCFRSTRPLPPHTFAWRDPFPFKRGDTVQVDFRPTYTHRPHIEDQQSNGLRNAGRSLSEGELVDELHKAEMAEDLTHLFDCHPQLSTQGGRALWVSPHEAKRSICGCEYVNVRFRLYLEPQGFTLRAELALTSNERLSSLPVVDREWRRFVGILVGRIQRSNPLPPAERLLNIKIANRLCFAAKRFARIGLPRARDDQHCWLMLDSLFPQPKDAWADHL